MTEYDKSFDTLAAFPSVRPETTLASIISKKGLSQAHIAETEKYPHVTYFFNGGKEEPHKGERHILLESRKDIRTHDQAPKMRAKDIANKAIEQLKKGTDFIVMNFANADMVGHTANVPAIIKAVETIDKELKRVIEKIIEVGGTAIVTADHGNAEKNFDVESDSKYSAHTLNKVPFILVSDLQATSYKLQANKGTLANITPTILELMQINKPSVMNGESLLK